MTKPNLKILFTLGIIGSVFAVASDFLIIYTDLKTSLSLPFGFLATDISNWRPTLSLILALISYIAYISAYKGISIQLQRTNEKVGIWFYRILLANALGWLFIHSSQCVALYMYNILTAQGISDTVPIIAELLKLTAPLAGLLFATNTIPLLFLVYQIARGNTIYPKKMIFCNPVVVSVIAVIPWFFMKESGFWYSVFLSGGNIGMFFFFLSAYLFEKSFNERKERKNS